ncbi:molybdopterin-dependent oxidoreductase [Microbacterium rhizosphaerae]|uniref:Molybdopterin-dependent oxidoreductase n=1 Tax=Microbacterium rhizosphaerae TaxID=1678237 RepID=A0ABZ0SQ54_9MICO|nr:molybdopterin-dependent oxidoreductase [Microbacterium rhizosphaerae]WPR90379.1 molybdopterin-dependent oxidoreductase [Microbacterium rhizosphaerae]
MDDSHPSYPLAAVAGVASVVLGAGVGELVAAVIDPTSSPFAAIGSALIDFAPPWAKDVAISLFGTNDKAALLTGIAIVVLGLAALAGVLEARFPPWGRVVVFVFGLAGVLAALTRADAGLLAWLPSAVAGVLAAWVLGLLVIRLRRIPVARPVAPAPSLAEPIEASRVGSTAIPRTPPPDATPRQARGPEGSARGPEGSARGPEGSAPGPRPDDGTSRRTFLLWTGAAAAIGILAGVGGTVLRGGSRSVAAVRNALKLPAPAKTAAPIPATADFRIPGLAPVITPNADFYRIDTALIVPQVDPATWKLRIHGLVDKEVTLTWDELIALPLQESTTTLTCVSNDVGGNLISNAVWLGYPIRDLLSRAGVSSSADMVLSTSIDGFTASTPLEALTDGRDAILAVGMNGEPLPAEHGFPVRMVVPGLYGYVSATKWVTDLEVTRFADASAYWTQRGWSERGPIKLESRIDVPRDGASVTAGTVMLAGVAWQQHVGVSGVEVQIDDGPWQKAELATAISDDTWVQWRLPWSAASGSHTVRCRATSATGEQQTSTQAPPAPDGASGWHQIAVSVV